MPAQFRHIAAARSSIVWALAVLPGSLFGAEAGGALSVSRAAASGLGWVDWTIVVVYLGAILGLGAWVGRKQSSSSEYFTAATTHIHPFLVGISLYASLLSTISYLGKPGEMMSRGPVVLIAQIVSVPIAYWVISGWILPAIMRQRVTSAYELLEARLGTTGRLLGALLFVKLRLVWMGLLVYVSSTAIAVIVGVEPKWVPLVSVVIGIVPLIYTSMGGLRAVVLANVAQFFLLFMGAVVTIVLITIRCGGFSWWPSGWSPNWDTQPVFSLDPQVRVTVVGAIVSVVIWRICTAGGDQMAIQHYMATRDLKAARRSYLVNSAATVGVTVVLAVLGLALLGFFLRFPELLGPGMDLQKKADSVFPYFVANLLPTGIAGLVVAAIIAASSGMDTGVNAVTAVVMRDGFERFGWNPRSEAQKVRITKYVSFGIGFAVVGASLLVKHVPGNFLEMTNKLSNLEATTIFGLFFLALFVPCATPLGAIIGGLYGLTVAVLVAFWDVITGRPPVSFLYIGIAGIVFNIGVGYLVSRFGPRRENRAATLWGGIVLTTILVIGAAMLIALGRTP
ncbi:MAG: sodium-coupled permease [Verrucomicrobiota bacterium]